jgi:DNA mismatch repair protein MutL
VHPTKQEIKFEDEKIVYAFVQAAIKHALAQFSISPSIDFSLNADIIQTEAVSQPFTQQKIETITASELYRKFSQKHQAHLIEPGERSALKHWQDFYTDKPQQTPARNQPLQFEAPGDPELIAKGPALITDAPFYQLQQTYIIASLKNGFLLIHQQHAHERILFERYVNNVQNKQTASQQSLFPATLDLSSQDAALLHDILPDLQLLGYNIELFGNHSFIIQGVPADILKGNEKRSVELLLEQFKHFSNELRFSQREKLIHCMARQQAIKAGQFLTDKEMKVLVEELFNCAMPYVTPNGNPVFVEFNDEQLLKMFANKSL